MRAAFHLSKLHACNRRADVDRKLNKFDARERIVLHGEKQLR